MAFVRLMMIAIPPPKVTKLATMNKRTPDRDASQGRQPRRGKLTMAAIPQTSVINPIFNIVRRLYFPEREMALQN
jgi:hypothetical protein